MRQSDRTRAAQRRGRAARCIIGNAYAWESLRGSQPPLNSAISAVQQSEAQSHSPALAIARARSLQSVFSTLLLRGQRQRSRHTSRAAFTLSRTHALTPVAFDSPAKPKLYLRHEIQRVRRISMLQTSLVDAGKKHGSEPQRESLRITKRTQLTCAIASSSSSIPPPISRPQAAI